MDNGVHGEDSSSRNDNPVIVLGIRERGTDGSRFKVSFSDGSSFFCSGRLVSSFGLREGMLLEGDSLERFLSELERETIEAKALELLARREHSRAELKKKLLARSFSPAAVGEILDALSAAGHLNTRRFAEEWVRTRLVRHPEGRRLLYAGLLSHGVSRVEAESVLDALLTVDAVEEAALSAALKFARKRNRDEIILKKRLFSLGFDRKTTMKVIERLKGIR